jgi:tetratricopeptide (TPR) repeat protein
MKMPKRPRSHELQDESILEFQKIMPKQWVFRRKTDDYGIDGEVEIFDPQGNSTGDFFYVQFKATDEIDLKKNLKVTLKITTYNYFSSLKYPVLMVRYLAKYNKIYLKWAHSKLTVQPKAGKKTFLFKFDKNDEAKSNVSDLIEKNVRDYYEIRYGIFKFPILFELNPEPTRPFDYSPSDIIIANESFQSRSDGKILKFDMANSKDAKGVLIYKRDKSQVVMGGGCCSFVFDGIEKYKKELNKFISDVYICIGFLIACSGHYDVANVFFINAYQFTNIFCRDSRILAVMINSLFKNRNYDEIIELVKIALKDGRLFEINFLGALLRSQSDMANNKNARFIVDLFSAISHFLVETNATDIEKGIAKYNLANIYREQQNHYQAIKAYNSARKLEPKYLQKDYFFMELGGVLFDNGRPILSATIYKRSTEVESDNPERFALYGDALLFSGKYQLAEEKFAEYLSLCDMPRALWVIKKFCLSIASFDNKKIIEQKRDVRKAREIMASWTEKDGEAISEKAVVADLLYNPAWRKAAELYHSKKEYRKATYSFLWAAICDFTDLGSWVDAIICAFYLHEVNLATLIFDAAYTLNKSHFLELLFESLDKNKNDGEIELVKRILIKAKAFIDERNMKKMKIRPFDSELPDLEF